MIGRRASAGIIRIVESATLAVELTTTILVIVAVICVALLVLIVVAPWRRVRDEPPLDPEVEAKLLLHRDPDEPTGELPATTIADLGDEADDRSRDSGYDDLRDL
jgi:hypothetical protein